MYQVNVFSLSRFVRAVFWVEEWLAIFDLLQFEQSKMLAVSDKNFRCLFLPNGHEKKNIFLIFARGIITRKTNHSSFFISSGWLFCRFWEGTYDHLQYMPLDWKHIDMNKNAPQYLSYCRSLSHSKIYIHLRCLFWYPQIWVFWIYLSKYVVIFYHIVHFKEEDFLIQNI